MGDWGSSLNIWRPSRLTAGSGFTRSSVEIRFDGLVIKDAFRYDLLVEDKLLIELKSSENMMPVHGKQLLTYLRLMHLPLGLLMNFGAPTFKLGLKRIVNNHHP